MWRLPVIIVLVLTSEALRSQPVPAVEENIPFLVTFGNKSSHSWGDNDFRQIFFFVVPATHKSSIFIRVFDPDIGGKHDEIRGGYNTKMMFSVYGGAGAVSANDEAPRGQAAGYDSGNILAEKTFGNDAGTDDTWYAFGPFNPMEGEDKPEFGGRVFKLIVQGLDGDDGNLYRFFLSTDGGKNKAVEGGNAFTYEYSFRLHSTPKSVSHIYPFVDNNTVAVRQYNFDFDDDAIIRIVSVSKNGLLALASGDNKWVKSEYPITEEEKGGSLDLQIIKTGGKRNNNVVFYITNQYGRYMPFYSVPIGGIPRYKYRIGVREY
ncbi:MAG: hypothetical protein ACE5DN_05805 [Flavobacteriales bacterium]